MFFKPCEEAANSIMYVLKKILVKNASRRILLDAWNNWLWLLDINEHTVLYALNEFEMLKIASYFIITMPSHVFFPWTWYFQPIVMQCFECLNIPILLLIIDKLVRPMSYWCEYFSSAVSFGMGITWLISIRQINSDMLPKKRLLILSQQQIHNPSRDRLAEALW